MSTISTNSTAATSFRRRISSPGISAHECMESCEQASASCIGLANAAKAAIAAVPPPPSSCRILFEARHDESWGFLKEQITGLPAAELTGAVISLFHAWQVRRITGETLAEFAQRLGADDLSGIFAAGRRE